MRLKTTLSFHQLLTLFAAVCFGLALSVSSFYFLKERNVQGEKNRFDVAASNSALAIKRSFATVHTSINSINSLYSSIEFVGRQQFQRFVAGTLQKHPEILSLNWAPKVPYDKLDEYVTAARYDNLKFRVTERAENGQFQPAPKRDTYYPVFFAEPMGFTSAFIGFDMGSEAEILRSLKLARDTASWSATVHIFPGRTRENNIRSVILNPLYEFDAAEATVEERRDFLRGFTAAVLDIDKLVKTALAEMQLDKDISVFVVSKSKLGLPLALGSYGDRSIGAGELAKAPGLRKTFPIVVGQKQWTVMVQKQEQLQVGWLAPGALILFLIVTVLTTYFAYNHFTRHEHIRKEVIERTAELNRHKDHLEELVGQRTRIIARQAEELSDKLVKEQELNELQRNFISVTSHEFRTPLAIINMNAQRMIRNAARGKTDDIPTKGEKICQAVRRMTVLMESILSSAKMDEGKFNMKLDGECDITKILIDCCEREQELSPSHIITSEFTDLPPNITADSNAIDQVFTNLLSNAVKYSPDSPEVTVRAWREVNNIKVSVSDSGVGIDAEDVPKMFGKFFRAKTSVGIAGTGIGLNLVKMLIEEHGGNIALSSEKGEGTTFTVTLPVQGPNPGSGDEFLAEIS